MSAFFRRYLCLSFLVTLFAIPALPATLSITKSDSPDPVLQGSVLDYIVTVTNTSAEAATSVTVTDNLPADVTLIQATPSQGSCSNVGNALTCNLGTINAFEAANIDIFVRTLTSGSISNTATASATNAPPVSDTEGTNVLPAADLDMSKSDTPDNPCQGTGLQYDLIVLNRGPSTATNVVVTDTLPAGVTFLSAPPSCTYTAATRVVRCTLASLPATPPGNEFTFTVQVLADQAGPIPNSATATSDLPDDDLGNNTGSTTTNVRPAANLSIDKTSTPSVPNGTNLTYTIVVSNSGPSASTGSTVIDTLPSSVSFVSASAGCTHSGQPTGGSVTCTLGSIAIGANRTITLVVRPNQAGTITNSVTVAGVECENDAVDDNTSTVPTTVSRSGDLRVTKTDSPDPVDAGADITYTVTLRNNGPDVADNPTLTDNIPTNTTFQSLVAAAGFTCTTPALGGTGTISCSAPNIAPNTDAVFTITVRVNAGTAGGTVISNTATVSSTTTDTVPGNNSDTETTTVRSQADLSIVKTDSPDPVNAGANITYTITLTRTGPDPAANVVVSDTIPANTTFVSLLSPAGFTCTTPAVGGTGAVSCSATSFAGPTAVFTLTVRVNAGTAAGTIITNTATVTSPTDTDSSNNSDTETTTVQTSVDVSVSKTDSPDPVNAGSVVAYTVTVSNSGPSTATNVVVVDTPPPGLAFTVSNVSAGLTCAPPTATTVTCTAATLNPAQGLSFQVNVTTSTAGTITNNVTVTSTETDSNTNNNSDSESTTVLAGIDLSVTKTDSPDPVSVGAQLIYTITVTNAGASAATNVTVVDTLPAGVTFNSATPSQGGSCLESGSNITCVLGTIAANGTATVAIRVTPNTPGTKTNSVTVTGSETETNTTNNTDTEDTSVNPALDLELTKSDSPDPVSVGSVLTYTIVVRNNGPSAATGVVITDTLPAGVTFNSASATVGTCAEAAGIVTCTIGNLSASGVVTATISITPNTVGTVTNTAAVQSTEGDSNNNNNTDTEETVVQANVALSAVKTASPNPARVGEPLIYTIVVTNNGSSPANGVVLTDTLPSSVTYNSSSTTQGSCSHSGGVVTCTLGTIAGGANATVTINVTPTQTGTLSNVASVTADDTPGTITPPVETPVLPQIGDSIPTVSEWGLIIMGLMLAFAAFVTMSRR